ncbi:MAG: GSCFA domain-containing protein [Bacteroidales bacterium]|nr:GSCFA domain-containing protein [Bacteroidales bacterium]
MLKLQTPVTDQECKVGISYKDRILMMGSCFSENIGRQLADFGFDICVNPFGTLYNPVSIFQSLDILSGDRLFSDEDCIQIGAGDERWCSFSHHTSFARSTREEFLADANAALSSAREFFAGCNKIIITLGTAWCFRNVNTGSIVSNCLKRPAKEFVRERLAPSEITDILCHIAKICSSSESLRQKDIIFTVSPIRHFKDGAHGNQISKASLLVGTEDFLNYAQQSLSNLHTDYFPAYEIVMDELRDYRFYAEDMCHPSSQAVDYIRERFLSWALPASEHPVLEENIRNFKRISHKKQ